MSIRYANTRPKSITYNGDDVFLVYRDGELVWAKQYTISYDANGGTGAPADQTKTHGVDLTLSTTKPTRSSYSFQGWADTASGGSVKYSAGSSYTENADATLYAVWSYRPSHSHSFDSIAGFRPYDDTQHYIDAYCASCGNKYTYMLQTHNFKNVYTNSLNKHTVTKVCRSCDYEQKSSSYDEDHDWEKGYGYDSNYHWTTEECICGAGLSHDDREKHKWVYQGKQGPYDHYECSVCGYGKLDV
jgi:hypothetical protein